MTLEIIQNTNGEQLYYRRGESLLSVFDSRVRDTPERIAVIDGHLRLTYQDLYSLSFANADVLASHIRRPGGPIPVLLSRSASLVAAIMGILRSGNSYCLLEPSWPAGRIADLLDQLSASVVMAPRNAGLPVQTVQPVLSLPTKPRSNSSPDHDRYPRRNGDSVACVFLTSGTTGKPKAVLSPDRATVRLFEPGTFAPYGPQSVVTQASALPWDGFTLDLWSALLNGGTSVVVPEPHLDPFTLRQLVRRYGVNTVFLTTSLFNLFVDEDLGSFEGVRVVLTGGEKMRSSHATRFKRRYPETVLVNGYGPVETTVFATAWTVPPEGVEGDAPVGHPVPRTGIHILSGDRQCPPGEVGEICISGDGLALGYWNDEAATAERFANLDLAGEPVRVYRTGDLGYTNRDGVLHFRGRMDRQIKLRGHRIEPAAVEASLAELTGARHCVCLPRRDADGVTLELIAFLVDDRDVDEAALRTRLASILPSYLVPDRILAVDQIPLKENGKMDEERLLERAGTGAPSESRRPVQSDDVEAEVLRAAARILGISLVPRDRPLTDLGASSLDLARLCARMSTRLRRPVPLSEFMRQPTVSGLISILLRSGSRSHDDYVAGGENGADAGTGADLSYFAEMNLRWQWRFPDDRSDYCLLTWRLRGTVDAWALEQALADVQDRHEALRAAYVLTPRPEARSRAVRPPVLLQGASDSANAALAEVRFILAQPLRLADGQVWRAALFSAGADTHVLGIVVHHVAFDGWSESVLARDLSSAYSARCGGQVPDLGPTCSLRRVGSLRTAYLSALDLNGQFRRAAERLAETPSATLPAGTAVTATGTRPVRTARADIGGDTPPHARLAAAHGVTSFVVLLAAYAHALRAVSGASDFAVGVPVSCRFDARLHGEIGNYINYVPVRLTLGTEDDERKLIALANESVAAAMGDQDVPFDELEQATRARRTASGPLVQHIFAVQDNATAVLDLPGTQALLDRDDHLMDIPTETFFEVWPPSSGYSLTHFTAALTYKSLTVSDGAAQRLLQTFTEAIGSWSDRTRPQPGENLEVAGRVDDQANVRGFRIEAGEAREAVAACPEVRQAAVTTGEGDSGDRPVLRALVPDEEVNHSDLAAEHVAGWRSIFDETAGWETEDPQLNTAGWLSSNDALPIPAADMKEWVSTTVDRIKELRPSKILEVGCGTGLLAWRLVSEVREYVGTDLSRATAEQLRDQLDHAGVTNAEVFTCEARDITQIGRSGFDTVILNSVVQYFPDQEYLEAVLVDALTLLDETGSIFVGDVRSLPLLSAQQTAMHLSGAAPTDDPAHVARKIRQAVAAEDELVIDPRWFVEFARRHARVGDCEILPKRGRAQNEMTQFRYDVKFRLGASRPMERVDTWHDWRGENLSLDAVRTLLADAPRTVGITSVTNERVIHAALASRRILHDADEMSSIAVLRELLRVPAAVDPEDVWGLAREFPYRVHLSWIRGGADGDFDAVFVRDDREAGTSIAFPPPSRRDGSPLINNPLAQRAVRELSAG